MNCCHNTVMEPPSTKVKDLVCGMDVDPARSISTTYEGKDYYFCAPGCKQKFEADPEKYVGPKKPSPQPEKMQDNQGIYTCPMHPEIRQKGPGSCPICGMALEPVEVSL